MQTYSAKIYEINMPGGLNILKYLMTGVFACNELTLTYWQQNQSRLPQDLIS
jgi:hypothetical protein